MKKILFILLFLFSISIFSQSVDFQGNLVSRYIWRGVELSQNPNIQPNLSFTLNNFTIGTFGSYPISDQENSWDETDLYLIYTIDNLNIILTDYYFPSRNISWSCWKNDETSAHLLEAGLSYIYDFFDVSGCVNILGDDSYTTYFELGANCELVNVPLRFFTGFTPGTEYNVVYDYRSTGFSFTNFGVKATKEKMFLKLSASYIINPIIGAHYLVFSIGV